MSGGHKSATVTGLRSWRSWRSSTLNATELEELLGAGLKAVAAWLRWTWRRCCPKTHPLMIFGGFFICLNMFEWHEITEVMHETGHILGLRPGRRQIHGSRGFFKLGKLVVLCPVRQSLQSAQSAKNAFEIAMPDPNFWCNPPQLTGTTSKGSLGITLECLKALWRSYEKLQMGKWWKVVVLLLLVGDFAHVIHLQQDSPLRLVTRECFDVRTRIAQHRMACLQVFDAKLSQEGTAIMPPGRFSMELDHNQSQILRSWTTCPPTFQMHMILRRCPLTCFDLGRIE